MTIITGGGASYLEECIVSPLRVIFGEADD